MVFPLTQKAHDNIRDKIRHSSSTTRGLGLEEFEKVGNIIGDVLDGLASNKSDNSAAERHARNQIG